MTTTTQEQRSILEVLADVDWFVYEDVETCVFRNNDNEDNFTPLRIDVLYVPIFYEELSFLEHETMQTFFTPEEVIQYVNDIYMSKRNDYNQEEEQLQQFRHPNKPLVYENFEKNTSTEIIESVILAPVNDEDGVRRDSFLDCHGRVRFEGLAKIETDDGKEVYFVELGVY